MRREVRKEVKSVHTLRGGRLSKSIQKRIRTLWMIPLSTLILKINGMLQLAGVCKFSECKRAGHAVNVNLKMTIALTF